MRSFFLALRLGPLLVVVVGLVVLAYSAVMNALFYTKTRAEVVRVEEKCALAKVPVEEATNCPDARAKARGKPVRRFIEVHLRYTSPADGRIHDGTLFPFGAKATQAQKRRPGDHLQIYARDNDPEDIKAE